MPEEMKVRISNALSWVGFGLLVWSIGMLVLVIYLGRPQALPPTGLIFSGWLLAGGVNYILFGNMRLLPFKKSGSE